MAKRWIVFLFLGIFLISLVSAASPFTNTVINKGLIIEHPLNDPIKANQDHDFHFHVYNATDGKPVNYSLVTCYFHWYNQSGVDTFVNDKGVATDGQYDKLQTIKGGNITTIGQYSYVFQCNSSTEGGFYSHDVTVTSTGFELSTGSSIFYAILIFLMILLLVGTLYGTGKLPGMNEKDEDGRIMSVKWGKYLRAPLYFVAWMLFIAILYISSNLAFAYLGEQLFAKVLFALFRICFGVTPLIVVVWFVWFFVRFFQDKKFQTLLNRGIFPQGKGKKW
jgi:hypothetical protein